MNCKQCRERLHDFLDDTLEAAERAQVSAHAAACDACRRELDQLRKMAALVGSLDELPEPAGFLQAVRERIDKPTVWERVRGLLSHPLRPGVTVSVFILAFIAVFVVMNLPPKPSKRAKKPTRDNAIEVAYRGDEESHPDDLAEGESHYWEKTGPAGEPERTPRSKSGEGRTGGHDEAEETEAFRSRTQTVTEKTAESDEVAAELETAATATEDAEARGSVTKSKASVSRDLRDETLEAGDTDLDKAEQKTVGANGSLVLGAGGPNLERLQRAPGKETVILLFVFDLPKDLSNVQQIVDEEGGQLVERRAKKALTGLVVQMPSYNYDRTVQRLSVYNDMNKLAIKQDETQRQQQAAAGKQRQGWLKPLPVIVQSIIDAVPRADQEENAE